MNGDVMEEEQFAKKTGAKFSTIITLLCGAMLILQIYSISRNWNFYLYDFRAFYSGPYLHSQGLDPYSVDNHLSWAKSEGLYDHALPFVYSPAVLFLFKPLTYLDYVWAFYIWLIIQVLLLTAVIFLAVRLLCLPFHIGMIFFTFGLNGSVAAVLRSGQMTIFLLFSALLMLLLLNRGNRVLAMTSVTVAASIKIWVLPVLAVAAVPLRFGSVISVMAFSIVPILIGFSGRIFAPELQNSFEERMAEFSNLNASPSSPYDQSIKNIISYLVDFFSLPTDFSTPIFYIFACTVFLITAACSQKISKGEHGIREKNAFVFSLICLGMMLILPRAILYQWAFCIPALCFSVGKISNIKIRIAFICLCCLPTLYVSRYIFGISTDARLEVFWMMPWSFWNYTIVFMAWIFLVLKASSRF